jgi:hypothetical protein
LKQGQGQWVDPRTKELKPAYCVVRFPNGHEHTIFAASKGKFRKLG